MHKDDFVSNVQVRIEDDVMDIDLIDQNEKVIIECDKNYFRPLDVNTLLGDARKARKELNWKPKIKLESLIQEMIKSEYDLINANK